ncbi:hypothetical protein ACP4OV_007278 [Aristida adscensionis]
MASPGLPAALSDDLLEEILLRVADPTDLARASAACVPSRHLIADGTFLRRYRSLHPPLLLGFLSRGFQSVEPPHGNAPAARALAAAAGFSFEYLPPGCWDPCDARDGRVLLQRRPPSYEGVVFPDLAVCDPLSRKYLLLPAIHGEVQKLKSFDAFLLPSGDWEDTSFRVVGMAHCKKKLLVFDYSSVSGCSSVGASTSGDDLGLDVSSVILSLPRYVYGCFYWQVYMKSKLLKLDMNAMEFSTVDAPPQYDVWNIVIVEAGEGRIGVFSRIRHDTFVDYYTVMHYESDWANKRQMRNVILLPANYRCYIFGAAEGYIFLVGIPKVQDTGPAAYFSLKIETLEIEMVGRIRSPFFHLYPYFGFPPWMSPRRI